MAAFDSLTAYVIEIVSTLHVSCAPQILSPFFEHQHSVLVLVLTNPVTQQALAWNAVASERMRSGRLA